MADLLDAALSRLVGESGAEVAVIWSRQSQSDAWVLSSHPKDFLPPGTVVPIPPDFPVGIERDPALLAAAVPTTLRIEMSGTPRASAHFELQGANLLLQLVWSTEPAESDISTELQRLVTEQISYLAALVDMNRRSVGEAERLQNVVGGLDEGVVSVDIALGQADVNAAAAKFLNLNAGRMPTAEFASAMNKLMSRTTNRDEIADINRSLLADPSIDTESIWHFREEPTHLRVVSMAVQHLGFHGRVWVFTDESVLSQALAASEQAAALITATSEAMIDPQVLVSPVRDGTGRIVDFTYRNVNQSTCDYLRMSREQLIGTTLTQTLPNIVGSGLMAHYIRCAETGEPVVLDDFLYYDETLQDARRYDVRASRATDDMLAFTWRDITERSEYVQRVAQSEEQYRLIAQNSGDVVARLRDGRFIWLSPSAEGLFGAPPEHWIGKRVRELVPPEDAAVHLDRLHRLETGETVFGRIQIVDVSGERHWIHLHARPFYDSTGRQDGAVASLRLIDDEVAAEQVAHEARESQNKADARFRRMMENSEVGMSLNTPDGLFVDVNDALCEFLGYDAETLCTKTWQEVTAPATLDEDIQKTNDLAVGIIDSYRTTKQFIDADGHLVWADLSVSCLRNSDGDLELFVAQFVDVTDEVESREQLRESEELSRALAERLKAELHSAAMYVESTMPSDLTGPVGVSSWYMPSEEIGGDGLHYRWIDDDHLKIYLIDVSGHGVKPALLSVSVHNLIRSGALPTATLLNPDQMLDTLNSMFPMDEQGGAYFTIWYGIYQSSTRTLRFASAGHPPALAIAREGDAVALTPLSSDDGPAGMFPDSDFTCQTYQVPVGGQLLVCSDGAYELPLGGGRYGSYDEFVALCGELAAAPGWSLDELINRLRARSIDETFEDDCSLILASFP